MKVIIFANVADKHTVQLGNQDTCCQAYATLHVC